MVKEKSRTFIINCGTYPYDVFISIGQTDKQFLNSLLPILPPKAFKQLQDDQEILVFNDLTQARVIMFTTGQFVIRFRSTPDEGVIAHEIFHVVEHLFRTIQLPLGRKSSEAYAYLIGHLTTKFFEKLKKA